MNDVKLGKTLIFYNLKINLMWLGQQHNFRDVGQLHIIHPLTLIRH